MTRRFYLIALVLLLAGISAAQAAKPKWVKKRPSEKEYYIGIGMAYKSQNSGLDYAKKARADALREMASEIEVNISANSLLRQFEDNYRFQETFESEISTSAEENLSGYEVQTWENKREYWVLMRLNKNEYRRRNELDLNMAKKRAATYLLEARRLKENQEITASLAAYFKAIESLENHLSDDLAYRTIDGNINLGSDIVQDLRSLFGQIAITPENPNYNISFSKSMESPLQVKVEYFLPDGRKIPVHNFPLHFRFTEGAGVLQEKVTTNPGGEVSSYIQKLESSRKKQQVTAAFDYTALLQKENIESPLVAFFLPQGTIPHTTFNIELQKSTAWFDANESIFGSQTSSAPFANRLKSQLNETFFNFTFSPEQAKYHVVTNAYFRKGEIKKGNGYEVYLVFADLYISVLSADTHTEIFNGTISGIKGMRPGGYDYALREAREKLLEQFKDEIYPQLEGLNF
ncbi:LPP20 family lipoprotein [Marinilabilia sp.]|uniref:LPP20 family lipoprotein n=1 Tax=Marinilabilia sp. TaxID=2021252 RepID=UPI0025C54787|nr:LPP20 family lipoprotein [Marinilabilia sp.]